MENKSYDVDPKAPIKIDPRNINAEVFGSYEELQASMAAADEAMLELGPTYGLLSTSGASRKEAQQFLSIYGEALLRRGKLRQLCVQAEEGLHAHLIPQPKTEVYVPKQSDTIVEPAERTTRLRAFYDKIGSLLAGASE